MHYFKRTFDGYGSPPSVKLPSIVPSVVLIHDRWDDYSFKTTHYVYFFDGNANRHDMGPIKILHQGQSPNLPAEFESLNDEYISLGNSVQYYSHWIETAGFEIAAEVFLGLRDVVANPEWAIPYNDSPGFKNSLLRFSEYEKAYKEAGHLLGRSVYPDRGFEFIFTCRLNGFSGDHKIAFSFKQQQHLPYRVVAFVGKNGTGKSGVLAHLASALSGASLDAGTFFPGRPTFSRTVCVSYTVFQPFEVPVLWTSSYRYCGLRNAKGLIDFDSLQDRMYDSLQTIIEIKRAEQWLALISLEDLLSGMNPATLLTSTRPTFNGMISSLSSGQRIVVSTFTDLLANIEKNALILFDEPETYLHPTLLSTLLRLLHKILEDYESYAIVATHSPIVIQEVLADSVRVFGREGSVPTQDILPIESFGENLTEIVDTVFHVNDDDKNYRNILKELAHGKSFEELLAMFTRKLSLNARLYLKTLYGTDENA